MTVSYESSIWPVCEMTEDATLGHALELASAADSSDANYQVVLFQRGGKDTYADFIQQSESDLKEAYGVISPRKVNLSVDGATVTAVRCDIQAYYAVLATITYDSGDVVYVPGPLLDRPEILPQGVQINLGPDVLFKNLGWHNKVASFGSKLRTGGHSPRG